MWADLKSKDQHQHLAQNLKFFLNIKSAGHIFDTLCGILREDKMIT